MSYEKGGKVDRIPKKKWKKKIIHKFIGWKQYLILKLKKQDHKKQDHRKNL